MPIPKASDKLRSLFGWLLFSIALGVTILALAAFIPGSWLCDLFSQFRLAYAVIQTVCLVNLLCLRCARLALIVLSGLVINGMPIGSLFLADQSPSPGERQTITILNFNSEFQHNDNYSLLEKIIDERNPDIIALVEINKKWLDAISSRTNGYQVKVTSLTGPGMALFSKFPIEHCKVQYFGKSHHPRIIADLRVDKQLIHVVTVHPTTPKSDWGYKERNQEFTLIKNELKEIATPKFLVGDLNCGPWSSEFAKFGEGGLRDSQQGFGPQPTWPARTGRIIDGVPIPPTVPIDHVLVGKDVDVLERITGPAVGSDHLPVFVKVTIPK